MKKGSKTMKRKYINRLICACLSIVCIMAITISAEDGTPQEATTTQSELISPVEEVQTSEEPIEDKNTLEGVLYTFLTFFFKDTTVSAYGEFFAKISIVASIALVFWIIKSVFGIFKKRR